VLGTSLGHRTNMFQQVVQPENDDSIGGYFEKRGGGV
jgi:hypothetical protein